jgi:hypothetical protein
MVVNGFRVHGTFVTVFLACFVSLFFLALCFE